MDVRDVGALVLTVDGVIGHLIEMGHCGYDGITDIPPINPL